MKVWQRLFGAAVAAVALLVTAATAQASLIYTASGGSGTTARSASATITTSANSLTIALSDLLANPSNSGQEVSGVLITLSNGPSTISLFSDSGQLVNISGGVATNASGSISGWSTSINSGTITLASAGTDLIIGPGPSYSNAGTTITSHNPEIQNTGTFVLQGFTSTPLVTGVQFEFGTSSSLTTLAGTKVPEPAAAAMFGMGLLGLIVARRWRSNRAAS